MATNGGDVDVVDFEPDEDDLMDEEGGADMDDHHHPAPKLRSATTGAAAADAVAAAFSGPKKTKGRGFRDEAASDRNSRLAGKEFDSLLSDGGPGP